MNIRTREVCRVAKKTFEKNRVVYRDSIPCRVFSPCHHVPLAQGVTQLPIHHTWTPSPKIKRPEPATDCQSHLVPKLYPATSSWYIV